jgi:hypothetical protein
MHRARPVGDRPSGPFAWRHALPAKIAINQSIVAILTLNPQ